MLLFNDIKSKNTYFEVILMKKSKGIIFIAIIVIALFWGFIFIVGSDGPDTQTNSGQVDNTINSSTTITSTTETTTETTTEESTTLPETTTEENTTEEETTTKKAETTTKKTVTTTKKETTTKKTETTTKKVTTTVNPDSRVTVFYTKTGKKYHYENPCGNGTYYSCTLAEAKDRNLSPCEKCVLH